MTTPTGKAIVEAITQILERQNREGQEAKQFQAIRLLGAFTQQHGIPPQTGAVSTLSRLLRKLNDPDVVRQIRSMSDSLLNMEEHELASELIALRDRLMPIEARIHQVKTKTAFVSTMLRPFSPKYTFNWFQDRDDFDVKRAKEQIGTLEIMKLNSVDDLVRWARGVAEIFEQVVVYRGADAADIYSRPNGTVSEKSSKTYLQAWGAFMDHFKEEVWLMVGGDETANRAISSSPKTSRRSESFSLYALNSDDSEGLDQDVPTKSRETVSMKMAPPSDLSKVIRMSSEPRPKVAKVIERDSPTSTKQKLQWIQIFIESKIDSAAQATRTWESRADFRQSLQKWLDTLPIIWGPAAEQFVAKVSVKNETGQSDLTVPSLTLSDAAKRLTQAVEMQQE